MSSYTGEHEFAVPVCDECGSSVTPCMRWCRHYDGMSPVQRAECVTVAAAPEAEFDKEPVTQKTKERLLEMYQSILSGYTVAE